ncbi:MAG: endo-1,4-beta-xylanase, partial [Methanomassiliicoccales archaeon]
PLPTATATPTSTPTATPTATPTSMSVSTLKPTATASLAFTPSPVPQNLPTAKDLKTWVEQYVHAYGGRVSVNNVLVDGNQLVGEIQSHPDQFLEAKKANNSEYVFLVVNGVPLGVRSADGNWQEATLRNVSALTDVKFGVGGEPLEPRYYFYPFGDKDRALRAKQALLVAPADIFQTGAIMWKGEGIYDWSRPDQAIRRFQNERLQVRATNIIWAKDYHPQWLTELAQKGVNDPERYRERFTRIMRDYIRAAATRYRGKFVDWVLLNEILDDAGKLDQNNFWVRIVGPDIARIAIQEARTADPDISIVINDYVLMWNDPKTNGMVSFLEGLKQEGLLTSRDAVGIQAHDSFLNPKWTNLEQAKREFKDTLRKFGRIGIHVRITELDLFDVFNDDLPTKLRKSSMYRTIVEACFEINAEFGYPVVDSIVTWGIKNDESWQYYVTGSDFGYPLYFDKDFNPEPAYYEMLGVFYKNVHANQ